MPIVCIIQEGEVSKKTCAVMPQPLKDAKLEKRAYEDYTNRHHSTERVCSAVYGATEESPMTEEVEMLVSRILVCLSRVLQLDTLC